VSADRLRARTFSARLSDGGSIGSESVPFWSGELLNSRSLFLRIPVLELFPPSRGVVVPPAQGVRVDFSSHPDRGVPQALGYRGKVHSLRQQMTAMAVAQRVQAGALGQLQPAGEQRDRRGNRIGLQWRAIRVREDQVEVGSVIRTELLAEPVLALAVRLECDQRSCRYTDRPWPLRFVPLNSSTCLVCVSDRVMMARPSWMSDQRRASTSPRRAPVAADISRNIGRHQGLVADLIRRSCCAGVSAIP